MQVPVRLLRVVHPSEHPGLLLATAYGTAALSVAPFLLPAIAEEYDIGLGLASFPTAAQLAGFVLGSWGAGRLLRPRGRVLGLALCTAAVANALSAPLPPLALLVVLRVVCGIALGVITWFSWSQVFGDDRRMSRIAVVGPLVGLTSGPTAALVVERWSAGGIFSVLAVTALVPVAFSRRSGRLEPEVLARAAAPTQRHRAVRDAITLLGGLGLLTLGGSAVFTYGAVIATRNTPLSITAISLAYSANAVASIPSARWNGPRGSPGAWLLVCAACAAAMGAATNGPVFVVAIATWGFAFWMGVPGTYSLLAAVSRHPAERAGDAQAVMAAGRVVGPLLGGVVLDRSGAGALGALGGGLMALAAVEILVVGRRGGADPDLPG